MKNPLHIIDDLLNGITMYRLITYGLSTILAITIIFGFTDILHFSGLAILLSTLTLLAVSYVANKLFAILWDADTNAESWVISSLILALILPPATTLQGFGFLALGSIIAMASKYIIAIHHRHLFNPAALAALALGFGGLLPAIWWVGAPQLLLLFVVYGFMVLRKLHRFQLFLSFAITAVVVAVIVGLMHGQAIGDILVVAFASSPLVFLGTIMLTEPETMPPSLWQQRIYGAIVGVIFTSQLNFGFISATPEVALIVGNIYAYIVGTKYKVRLRLEKIKKQADNIYEFTFVAKNKPVFSAGQYLEWTLPHRGMDMRGNRRTFSIISAPEDDDIRFTIRTSERSSSFKSNLLALKKGDYITAGHLSGDFILPKDQDRKLVFIAGGIGVTPFVSMIRHVVLTRKTRDIVLFYLVSKETDYCYQDLWKEAAPYGVKVIPVLTGEEPSSNWKGLTGRLTEDTIKKEVPSYSARTYYLSGPNALVNAYTNVLRKLGIGIKMIVTDYFSGY
jgi:ferredoxin-NADP reductase